MGFHCRDIGGKSKGKSDHTSRGAPSPVVFETVKKIDRLISEVAALQRKSVEVICTRCESPCCTRAHYLFTEKDVLFLRLSGKKRRWRKESRNRKGCWFLDKTGCVLDPGARPFICHRYMCPDLEMEMKRRSSGLTADLEEKFRLIDTLRSQMWSEYLDEER